VSVTDDARDTATGTPLPPWVLADLAARWERGDPVGTIMAVARKARGWSQKRAGSVIGYSQSSISRAESGNVPLPLADQEKLLRGLLGVPQHVTLTWSNEELLLRQLFGDPQQILMRSISAHPRSRITVDTKPAPTHAGGDPDDGTTDVNRRSFLTNTGTMIVLGVAAPPEQPHTTQVGPSTAEEITQTAHELRNLDHKGGGATLLPYAKEYLQQARSLLNYGTFTGPGVERELRSAIGILALTVAWLSYDAGDQVTARTLYLEASDVGQRYGYRQLAVDALNHLSHQATILGNARNAIDYARDAIAMSRDWASPRLTALLALREARGHAAAAPRDTNTVQACLTRAVTAFDREDPGLPDPYPWMGALDPTELAGQRGICLADLGNPAAAEAAFAAVYGRRHEPTHPRSRAHYWLRYATALTQQGKIDHACHVTTTIAPTIAKIHSGRVRGRLHSLNKQLITGPTAKSHDVTALQDVLREHGLLNDVPSPRASSR
jgi:transcriptional regulator with XRE-family HTH domain